MNKWIRKIEPAWMNIAGRKFALGSYKDLNGQLRHCFTYQDRVPLHRYEVQRRGTLRAIVAVKLEIEFLKA